MKRVLQGVYAKFTFVIAIVYSLYHIYTAGFGSMPDIQQPTMHALLGFILVFSLWGINKKEAKKGKIPFYDILIILVSTAACGNAFIYHLDFLTQPFDYGTHDLIFAGCVIFLIMEASRRTIGLALPILATGLVLYGWYKGGDLTFLLVYVYHFDLGIWGMLTYVSGTVLAIFMIFGSFLLTSGGGDTFIALASRLAGKFRGGPAKIAVVASSLFGMISGSPVANVATIGTFTIPLMKKAGYQPHVAAAVESTASTGGLLMPPVMGAAAFVMAELLGISYLQVCLYGTIPAILYYVSLFAYVHFEAVRTGLRAKGDVTGSIRDVLTWKRFGPFFLPMCTFLTLLVQGFTASFSVFCSIVVSLFCFLLKDLDPAGIKARVKQLPDILHDGGKSVAYVMPLMMCAQLVVGMLGQTGLGVQMASFITSVGGSSILLALAMAAVLTILLGMGVPPVGAYVLAVSVTAPALQNLGVADIAAHMFCFSFSSFAPITPPVCAAVFVGASIAEAPWLRTGITSMKIAIVAFIIPFSYCLADTPYLLGVGPIPIVLFNLVLVICGTVFISSGMVGAFFKGPIGILPRLLFVLGGFGLLISFGWMYKIAGACLVLVAIALTYVFKSRPVEQTI